MLKIKSLTAKNFLSIGNVSQAVSFDDNQLILVLGENLDQGGNDSRNGCGKTAALNALSYALYGEAIVKIKQDNLINKVNSKGMVVTLEFEKDGNTYRIERGRKPKLFKFYANGKVYGNESTDETTDEAQGDSRVTQDEIERTIGISHSMFKQIIALNTYNEPFLSLRANEQRDIIEQLLGITKLSEKADILKENLRITKDDIKEEEFRIKAVEETNKRIKLNISALEQKSTAWTKTRDSDIRTLSDQLEKMLSLDVDKEIAAHRSNTTVTDLSTKKKSLKKELTLHQKELNLYLRDFESVSDKIKTISSDEKRCPTCGTELDDHNHAELLSKYQSELDTLSLKIAGADKQVQELSEQIDAIVIGDLESTFYNSIDDAYEHKTLMEKLASQLESITGQENPYIDQIESLKSSGLQEISFEKINDLTELKDHQEFLLKLLTSKDSFIRKKIIDHNLSFLNSRLSHYLDKLGLPHEVKFKSDLEVEIMQFGRDFDFDNLSRGERTRLVLSLSWAFRDVYESLNSKINLLFIDELIDNGLDTNGVESALSVLKRMVADSGRSVFLISHRDELIGRVTGILKVIKEGGFSTFELSNSGNI